MGFLRRSLCTLYRAGRVPFQQLLRFLALGALGMAVCGRVYCQGVGASGDIKGSVTDANQAAVPRARILVVATQTGLLRRTVTDDAGAFRVADLTPTTYDVTAEFVGFERAIHKNVVVTVGQTVIVDFQLSVSPVTARLQVTWEQPLVDSERASQANIVEEKYIRNLPIDRRDYLTFTLLVPAITDSRRLTDNTDFRVKQTPQSGLSVYGNNGRGNNITVDGAEANDNTGGVLLTLGQDAVQEFQINRSNYSAELGGASGASINIVSKSGTNDLHGSGFAFFRHDALDARDPFAFTSALDPSALTEPTKFSLTAKGTAVKPKLRREQFGVSFGFPIKRDKAFMFVAYEGLRRREEQPVPLLTDSSIFAPTSGLTGQTSNQQAVIQGLHERGSAPVICTAGQPAIAALACAARLTSILTINPTASPLKAFWVKQFITNTGVFSFKATADLASVRLSHQPSSHNQFFVRYNFGRDFEQNPNVQALVGASQGTIVNFPRSHTVLGAWFHEFSAQTLNEARAQYTDYRFNVIPTDPGGPQLEINGFGSFGRNVLLPSLAHGTRYEFADNFTFFRGHHKLKAGAYVLLRGTDSDSHVFFPGRFFFGDLPGSLVSPCLSSPSSCGLPPTVTPASLNALQAAALGLPSFYQQGFGSGRIKTTNPLIAGFWEDSWAVRPNVTFNYGLRYELDKRYAPLRTDTNNFAPRISLSWDPFRNHKTVFRAGYGIFYAPIYFQIDAAIHYLGVLDRTRGLRQVDDLNTCASGTDCFRQIAQVFVQLNGVPGGPPSLTSALIFQTLFAQGKINCGTPTSGAEACITPADLAQFGVNVSNTGPIPPLTVLFSGASDYQNPYSQQAEIGVERDVGHRLSISLSYIHARTLHNPRARDKNLKPAPFLATGPTNTLIRRWNGPGCAGVLARNCFVNPVLLQDNVYESTGSTSFDGGIVEVNKRFGEHSSLLANYTFSKAFDDVTDFNADFQANDQTNLAAERGLSPFDQRHKLVIAGVFTPFDRNSSRSLMARLLSGVTVSPVLRGNSGHPFNLLAGTDVNGDRHSTSDRPPGAGRNTGQGPGFWTFDMRVTRMISFSESLRLQVTAEGFNLFNHTNFATVNNVVGSSFAPPFEVEGLKGRAPNQPLGFTAVNPMRQIQLGIRLSF